MYFKKTNQAVEDRKCGALGSCFSFISVLMASVLLFNAVPARADRNLSLTVQWYPQAQFAGYYIALEKGFYKEQGMDLDIISGRPDINGATMLAKGKTDFATLFLSSAIESRHDGIKLVNVDQIVQRSAMIRGISYGDGEACG